MFEGVSVGPSVHLSVNQSTTRYLLSKNPAYKNVEAQISEKIK